jgi:hypothetical protein
MNVIRHFQVIKRGRAVLAIGLLVAIAVAMLASFRVSVDGGPKLAFRKPETWSSTTKLLLTQPGFPWGRSVLPGAATDPAAAADESDASKDSSGNLQFADPSRLAYLAWIYSHFLMGDEVRTMLKDKPEGMDIQAGPLSAGGSMSAASLPIIGLTTTATTAAEARHLNDEVHLALDDYLTTQQRESHTPVTDRVVISTVDRPDPVRLKGHSINLGVMAFLLIMVASVSLVYLLENLRIHKRDAENLVDVYAGDPRLFGTTETLGDAGRGQGGAVARSFSDQRSAR